MVSLILRPNWPDYRHPEGGGLFLIKNMVDDMRVTSDEAHHNIELIMYLEGESHATS
jgi:anti-sigma regulatory factor (Ser/Thr protein kinase)